MKILNGIGLSDGYAIGKLHFIKACSTEIERTTSDNPAKELESLKTAIQYAKEELHCLFETALEKVGKDAAEIFSVHSMLLEDPDYTENIENYIREEAMSAEAAVKQTGVDFAEIFASMDDAYMKERAADIKDISDRLIRRLMYGRENVLPAEAVPTEPYIAAADDLTPSQTISMDKMLIKAIVTCKGSEYSHSAILARIIGIPAVGSVGNELDASLDGTTVIVDGKAGLAILEPDAETLSEYQEKEKEYRRYREELITK